MGLLQVVLVSAVQLSVKACLHGARSGGVWACSPDTQGDCGVRPGLRSACGESGDAPWWPQLLRESSGLGLAVTRL